MAHWDRIHEGVKFTDRDHRTLPEKFASLLDAISIGAPFYLVADARSPAEAWRAGWWTRATILSRDYHVAPLPMRQRRPAMDRENAVVPGSMVRRSNCGRYLTAPPRTGSPRPAPSTASAGSRSSSCAAICSGDRCAAWCAWCWSGTPRAGAPSLSPPISQCRPSRSFASTGCVSRLSCTSSRPYACWAYMPIISG